MDQKKTTVWPLRPASGGAPKRGLKTLQELHAYAHRDVRWDANQSGSQDHQATHVVQGAHGAWPEARTNFALPCLWEHSIQPCSTRGGSLIIPNNSPSERSAKPSSMSTCLRWWPAPPLLRGGVQYLTSSPEMEAHTCGALNGKHIAYKCPPKSGSQYFTTRDSTRLYLWPTTPNIVEPNNVVTCCVRLHGTTRLALVAYSLKPVKPLAQQVPTFLLFCDRRTVCMEPQQCCPRENVCARALLYFLKKKLTFSRKSLASGTRQVKTIIWGKTWEGL